MSAPHFQHVLAPAAAYAKQRASGVKGMPLGMIQGSQSDLSPFTCETVVSNLNAALTEGSPANLHEALPRHLVALAHSTTRIAVLLCNTQKQPAVPGVERTKLQCAARRRCVHAPHITVWAPRAPADPRGGPAGGGSRAWRGGEDVRFRSGVALRQKAKSVAVFPATSVAERPGYLPRPKLLWENTLNKDAT